MGPTNHEWPFELIIPGATAETVEGLGESSIKYQLKATVARGKFAYDLHGWKTVRIIRTLDPSALELSHAMTVENIWPNKIQYSIVIPQKAIVFGTAIDVEMKFTPLLKGLNIGTVRCQLIEAQEFTLPGSNGQEKIFKTQRDVEIWSFDIDEERHYQDMLDEDGQDGYALKESLPLPKTLKKCLQDCETNGIKIRHRVKFNIALHNPDGHTSELRATLPVTIFLSPNVPLDEAGNLLDQTPNYIHSADIGAHAPPLYGEHVLDQLYTDSDHSGHITPNLSSGMNTPFYMHSNTGSVESLQQQGAAPPQGVRPEALSTRLQNLTHAQRNPAGVTPTALRNGAFSGGTNTPRISISGDGRGHRANGSLSSSGSLVLRPGGYFHHIPHSRSNPLSGHPSSEEIPALGGLGSGMNSGIASGVTSGAQTPDYQHQNEELNMSKVPSYETATRAPLRNMSYGDLRQLPNYAAATSRPASPTRSHTSGPGMSLPASAHSRTLSSEPITLAGETSRPKLDASRRNKSFSHLGHLGFAALTGRRNTNTHSEEDGDRRLSLLRARGKAHA